MLLSFLICFCFISHHLFSANATGKGSSLHGQPTKQIAKPLNGTLNFSCYTCFEEMSSSFEDMRFCQCFHLPFCFISPHLSSALATGKGSRLCGQPTLEEMSSSFKDMRVCRCFQLSWQMLSSTLFGIHYPSFVDIIASILSVASMVSIVILLTCLLHSRIHVKAKDRRRQR